MKWEEDISFGMGIIVFILLGLYWVAPWLLISRGVVPPLAVAEAVPSKELQLEVEVEPVNTLSGMVGPPIFTLRFC